MTRSRYRLAAPLVIFVAAALLLEACGFHLRGPVDVPANMRVMYIQGVSPNSILATDLFAALRGSGVEVTDNRTTARSVLRILNNNFRRRVLSVSPTTGKVREFELYYSLSFEVTDTTGKQLVPRQDINLVRDYIFDETDVLGKSAEQQVLRDEMRRDVIQQVLRRLQAQS